MPQRIPTATQIRRHLEWHQRGLSPADCRRRIAAFLWDRGALEPVVEPTAVHPGPRARPPSRWQTLRIWKRGLAAAVVVLAAGIAGSLSYRTWGPEREPAPPVAVTASLGVADVPPASAPPSDGGPITAQAQAPPSLLQGESPGAGSPDVVSTATASPATEPLAIMPPADADPARIRFVADPWARVRIDGEETFLTPRAEPVVLAPGLHEVVFEHPRYGRAVYTLDLAADETRTVRHVFAPGTGS